jgi:hypothetical protein
MGHMNRAFKLSFLGAFVMACLDLALGCTGAGMKGKDETSGLLSTVGAASWEELSRKVIFFGHQSVGSNIIEGIEEIEREHEQIHLNIVEGTGLGGVEGSVFLHAKIGRNTEPQSKINVFFELLQNGLGASTDIAFFKFCYLDISASTDVKSLFSDYEQHLACLKEEMPGVKFLHVTVPLTTVQSGPKAWIKRIFSKPLGGYEDNAKRNEFNDLLRAAYQGKEPVFDLASVESTRPDGSVASFEQGGKTYRRLASEYTNDGAHLNERGRRIAAAELLVFLARLGE